MVQLNTTPELADVLTEDTIMVKVSVSNWKEAIRKAGELLVKTGSVEPRYINEMIKFCEKHNAYIVIAPGIALPHARPGDGVKKICISIITLKEPVKFGHPQNDPVDIVIALAAVDDQSHIKVLKQLAEILMDQKNLNNIRKARTKKEILKIFHCTQKERNRAHADK